MSGLGTSLMHLICTHSICSSGILHIPSKSITSRSTSLTLQSAITSLWTSLSFVYSLCYLDLVLSNERGVVFPYSEIFNMRFPLSSGQRPRSSLWDTSFPPASGHCLTCYDCSWAYTLLYFLKNHLSPLFHI